MPPWGYEHTLVATMILQQVARIGIPDFSKLL